MSLSCVLVPCPCAACSVQYAKKEEDNKDLSAEASDLWTLGRQLVKLAVENSSGGGVSSFFSYTTPNSGVYEVPCPPPHR